MYEPKGRTTNPEKRRRNNDDGEHPLSTSSQREAMSDSRNEVSRTAEGNTIKTRSCTPNLQGDPAPCCQPEGMKEKAPPMVQAPTVDKGMFKQNKNSNGSTY